MPKKSKNRLADIKDIKVSRFVVVGDKEYWKDNRENKWDYAMFTEEGVLRVAQECRGCTHCTNCINCQNSHRLQDCVDCEECVGCVNCHNLCSCRSCSNSSYLHSCLECSFCSFCNSCTSCGYCSCCFSCRSLTSTVDKPSVLGIVSVANMKGRPTVSLRVRDRTVVITDENNCIPQEITENAQVYVATIAYLETLKRLGALRSGEEGKANG